MAVRMLLKGMHWGYRARKDGSRTYYYWAWKNGPQIWKGEQLPAEIPPDHPVVAAYQAAHKAQREKRAVGFVSGLVADFRASTEFNAMADSTKVQWRRWLDRIEDEFGELELEGMDDRSVRKDIKDWRDSWIAHPRQADYAMQVLKRLLSFAVDRGDLDFNRAKGIKAVSGKAERSDLVWTNADVDKVCKAETTPKAVAHVIKLAALTGLRRGDLVALRWGEIDDVEISRATNKSRGKHIARIPILPETRLLLDEIRAARKGAPVVTATVLTAPGGKPWLVSYMTQAVGKAARANGVDRRLHDLRGTFVTRLAEAGLSDQSIADIVGWSVKAVARMRRTYVSKDAIAKDNVRRLTPRA